MNPSLSLKGATPQDKDIAALIQESTSDPYLGDIATTRRLSDVVAFYVKNIAVGFAIPRRDSDGRYRTGAIYITPTQRRKGYAKQYLKLYFKDKAGRAYIEPTNKASQSLFSSVGFTKSGKTIKSEGDVFEEWLRERSTPSSFRW